ncbi:aspartate 1-decarboxylase [Magnetococcales bacterium HHB-1]
MVGELPSGTITIVRAKMHGIQVTSSDLHYHGSITLDPEQCALCGIYPLEFVEIWNKNSGARISTYVIFGEPGSRCCILNGAAARTCQRGDEIIIAAAMHVSPIQLYQVTPRVLTFGPHNVIDQVLSYRVTPQQNHPFYFEILSEQDYNQKGYRLWGEQEQALIADLETRGWSPEEIHTFLKQHFG